MAAPTFVAASTGSTDATGNWAHTCMAPAAAGHLILVHIFQDGTAAQPSVTAGTNITALDGTADTWTRLTGTTGTAWQVGSPLGAITLIFAGRSTGTSAPTISGTNGGGDDLYIRAYEFQDASVGTTQAGVFENIGGITDLYRQSIGTSGTITDAAVTTSGADRLALNFVGINDDNTITVFTGETGGTWEFAVSGYIVSTGTDAAIYLMTAAMPSAGTIDGGTTTNPDATDAWGAAGFAIIGTTVVDTRVPYVNQMPQLLAH